MLAPGALYAQPSADSFYRSQNINMVIGYSPGGGYDAYARLLGRHLSKHIPGNPNIVPQNMPGAGSLRAASYLFSVAPKDGSTIGIFDQQLAIAKLLGEADLDAREFRWLGSMDKEVGICITSAFSPVKTWQDMLTKEHVFGGSGPGSDQDQLALALRNMFNTRTRVVSGYPGTNDLMLALERGEVDGFCGLEYVSLKSRYADSKVNIVVQTSLEGHPEIKTAPPILQLATNEEQKQIWKFISGTGLMGRSFAAPPNIPVERVQALRAAFETTMKDPELLAEAKRLQLEINPVTGEQIAVLLKEIYATPKEIIEKAKDITTRR